MAGDAGYLAQQAGVGPVPITDTIPPLALVSAEAGSDSREPSGMGRKLNGILAHTKLPFGHGHLVFEQP